MSHIGFRYTYFVLRADVLRTVIFSLEGAIKRSTANVRMPRWRKKSAERQKRNMNNIAFYAVSSSSSYRYLCPKLKTQKSRHSLSHQFRTQNTKHLYTNTMSHIGFRNNQSLILVCKTRPLNKWRVFLTNKKSNPFPVKRISLNFTESNA